MRTGGKEEERNKVHLESPVLQQITCKSDTTTISDVVPQVENTPWLPPLSSSSLLLLPPLAFSIASAGLIPLPMIPACCSSFFSSRDTNSVGCCVSFSGCPSLIKLEVRLEVRGEIGARVGLAGATYFQTHAVVEQSEGHHVSPRQEGACHAAHAQRYK